MSAPRQYDWIAGRYRPLSGPRRLRDLFAAAVDTHEYWVGAVAFHDLFTPELPGHLRRARGNAWRWERVAEHLRRALERRGETP